MKSRDMFKMVAFDHSSKVAAFVELLEALSEYPEDMRTTEMKRLISAGESFLGKYMATVADSVSPRYGIVKSLENGYMALPNGTVMYDCYGKFGVVDLNIKPWTPSKAAIKLYESTVKPRADVSAIKDKEDKAKERVKVVAQKLKRQQQQAAGKMRLGDIKYVSTSLYWQLKKFYGKDKKFPVCEGEPLATRVAKMCAIEENVEKYRPEDYRDKSFKHDALKDLYEKAQNDAKCFVKTYFPYNDPCVYRSYQSRERSINTGFEDNWITIIPGMEKQFVTLFEKIAAAVYSYMNNETYRWREEIKQTDIMSVINDVHEKGSWEKCPYWLLRGLRNEYIKGKVKDDVEACAKLLESSTGVEEAIINNNPDAEGLKPFVRDLLIRMNVFNMPTEETAA